MPLYNYMCDECKITDCSKEPDDDKFFKEICDKYQDKMLFIENDKWGEDFGLFRSSRLIFGIVHSIKESPEILCPNCNKKCSKTMLGMNTSFYFRGNGLAYDRAGARRDMHAHTLQYSDPYESMRQPGEKDHLINKFKNAGKFNPNRMYFTQ